MAELFDRIEINRAPRWPMLSRLLALSVVAHGLFLLALVYAPALRSILYVAGNMSGIKFVNEDYDRTLIGQRATVVQFAPHEKLRYPPDYFGQPAVEETTQLQPMVVQQAAPPPPMPVYRPRPVRIPRARPTPQPTPSPEVARATPSPTPDAEQKQADAEMDKIAKENGIERPPVINTKPFEEIAIKGKELIDQGKLDLKNSAIDVSVTAERNEDGTLKPETVRFNWKTASDENTAALAQQLVTALSQSKVLVVLKGAKTITMALTLDQQDVSVKVTGELPDEDVAKKTAEGYATLVALGRMAKKGTNEGELYNNLNFNNEGKQFNMSFVMPKDAAGRMIADMLAKKAAAAQNKS
jgi:hypothetical protein